VSFTIVKGEDRTLNFQIKEVDENDVTTYLDLTDFSKIEMKVPATGGSYISFTSTALEITVTDPKNGLFQVKMGDTKTALFKTGENQNIEVVIDINGAPPAGDRRIVQLYKAITVIAPFFTIT